MAYGRKKIRNKRKDQNMFSRTADRTRSKNVRATPMRGGFRI